MRETLEPPHATERLATKARLLNAAERLFAEHGFDKASLRAITEEAGANLAAVHYHFGSKEGLVQAVFARRLAPLNEERLELLTGCDETKTPNIECIVHAFVAPVVWMIRERASGAHDFACLVGRAFYQPDEELRDLVFQEFRQVRDRFVQALSRALPHLSQEEIYWRFHFMVGCMAHTAATGSLIERVSNGLCDHSEPDRLVRQLVAFLAAGLQAPTVHHEGDSR